MIKRRIKHCLDNVQTFSGDDLIKIINEYEEISFDVFDTLIKRDVPSPKDVFTLMEENLGIKNFAAYRDEAERKAGSIKEEPTLTEIYDQYPDITGREKAVLAEKEIEYELSLCTANAWIKAAYQHACKHKRVFILSDMYLSREVIEKILHKNGFHGYEGLVISNEVHMSKHSGKLFDYAAEKYHCRKMLHIGNDFISDYVVPGKKKIHACKISTEMHGSESCTGTEHKRHCLEKFIDNRIDERNDYFYNFGFRKLGPALYGFSGWLHEKLREDHIEEVFFMAREGWIMQKAYQLLTYDESVPCCYFEASRRSLRVPGYSTMHSLEEIMKETPLLEYASIGQIMDSFGLAAEDYDEIIKKHGYHKEELLKRDELIKDAKFRAFFNDMKDDVFANAQKESENLTKYLKQFDFSKKIALVDIGWRGSIQADLLKALDDMGIRHDITGYYFGLSKPAVEKLGGRGYKAEAYLFDCLNNERDHDTAISFGSLLETLFFERNGSVKKYVQQEDTVVSERYPYEYRKNNKMTPEAEHVENIQNGALQFIRLFRDSKISDHIGTEPAVMFHSLYKSGTEPDRETAVRFGDFLFFDNGREAYMARPSGGYMLRPRAFVRDLTGAGWKIGFLKRSLHIPLPYLQIYMLLHRAADHSEKD